MSTSDAAAREAAWLSANNDSLPKLLAADGGPWDNIQAYWPRSLQTRQTGLFVMRPSFRETRFSAQRKLVTYQFHIRAWWPIGSTENGQQIWELEQAALDAAIELLLERIRGFVEDKTHGGRFLSVAEGPLPGHIDVHFEDPDRTAPALLRADLHYEADEQIVAA
jgi:hypothetical protein